MSVQNNRGPYGSRELKYVRDVLCMHHDDRGPYGSRELKYRAACTGIQRRKIAARMGRVN